LHAVFLLIIKLYTSNKYNKTQSWKQVRLTTDQCQTRLAQYTK